MNIKRTRIGELGEVRQGLVFSRYIDPQSDPRPILHVANLSNNLVVVDEHDRRERIDDVRAIEFRARPNQILVALRGTALKAGLVTDGGDAVISASLVSITIDPDKSSRIHPMFITALINSKALEQQVKPLFSGSAMQGISLSQFKKLTIDLPPIEHQRQIAAALQALGRYQVEAEQHIALRKEELEAHLTPFVIKEHG